MKEKLSASLLWVLPSIVCAIAMLLVIFVPEPVGLANNGDFRRVIEPSGIRFVDGSDTRDRFVPNFVMLFTGTTRMQKLKSAFTMNYETLDYYTSQSLAIMLSKAMNLAWNTIRGNVLSRYKIFFLAFIYIAMAAIGMGLAVEFGWKRRPALGIFTFIIAILVFCDQGYLLYFNTFFGEAMQYSSTILCVGLYLKMSSKQAGIPFHIAYWLCALAMGLSKLAYAPAGILFSLLPLFVNSGYKRLFVLIGSAASCVILFLCVSQLSPSWIEEDTSYNAVFSGVLKHADDPAGALEELGLDPDYAILRGTESYQAEYPIDVKSEEFKAGFYGNISKGKILFYYLRHPAQFWKALEESMKYSKNIRPAYLTNTQYPSAPHEQVYRFSVWEFMRSHSMLNNVPVFILCCAAVLALAIYSKNLALGGLLAALAASAGINFVLPFIGNGVCDLAKHMFGFITFYDLMFFFLAGAVVEQAAILAGSRKTVPRPQKAAWKIE
jgi:hypothetical protein